MWNGGGGGGVKDTQAIKFLPADKEKKYIYIYFLSPPNEEGSWKRSNI